MKIQRGSQNEVKWVLTNEITTTPYKDEPERVGGCV